MRRSIATVSLSGTLNEKLTAVANAGFDGVEIFDQDLLCSLWTPRRIRERCDELGLKIEMLQPFRDLEGMTQAQHARAMRRFEGKLDIMAELGTDLVLVCASCQPDAIDDDQLSAEQLHRAAELAHERGRRIAFEALAWSTQIWDYRRGWKIVRMADHPALGTCQDTFHVLSRRLDPWAIRDIPGEKIFFVQLSDAPKMAMDILQRSRHYRARPGQGAWDVAGFLEHCLVAGYTGPLSLEIFNTVFRRADAERNARDAMRSLLYVEDAVAHRGSMPPGLLDSAPPAPRVTGLEFVELGVSEQHPLTAAALHGTGLPAHREQPRQADRAVGAGAGEDPAQHLAGGPRRPGRPAHRGAGRGDAEPGRGIRAWRLPACDGARARPRPDRRRRHRDRGSRRHRDVLQPVGRTPRALGRSLRPGLRRVRRAKRPRPAHRPREPGPALRQLRGGGAFFKSALGLQTTRTSRSPRPTGCSVPAR